MNTKKPMTTFLNKPAIAHHGQTTRRRGGLGRARGLLLAGGAIALVACGGNKGPGVKDPSGNTRKTASGEALSVQAAKSFDDAVVAMKQHDQSNNWDDATCAGTAKKFQDAVSEQGGDFDTAKYNAAIAHQRCKNSAEASKIFGEILAKNPKFHRARVQVALYDYQRTKDVNKGIQEMQQAIADSKFKNEEALVNVAMFYMIRNNSESDKYGANDFARAKRYLQSALAINDSFMPAFNQLAVYYFELAKQKANKGKKGGKRRRKVNAQALELAQLVCSQALRKNPRYAPVHNTSGLIAAELGDLSLAARSFGSARKLDKKFFEAHMNFAAVNLRFRGFKNAEVAYRDALKLKPKNYEAHLGLALALRGQINDSNFDAMLAESDKYLAAAKTLDAARPETYYNQAILVQEFKAREGGEKAEPVLQKAKSLFGEFIAKAGDKAKFAQAVKRAKERMEEIDQIIAFNRQTREDQKKAEADRARREAEALKNKDKNKETKDPAAK